MYLVGLVSDVFAVQVGETVELLEVRKQHHTFSLLHLNVRQGLKSKHH